MNITDEMSGAEKQKTLNEWLDEAEKLYGKCKPLIDSCIPDYDALEARQGRVITEDDDARTIISKVNAMLDLEKKINDAMKICQANECVENALKLGSTNRTRKLESVISESYEIATGAKFQYLKTMLISDKATLAATLVIRYDAIAKSDAGSSRGKTAGLMDRIAKQLEKFPDRSNGYWMSLKEMINYEKRFSDDSHALYRDTVRGFRQKTQHLVFDSLQTRIEEQVEEINEAANRFSGPHFSRDSDSVKHLSDENIANNGKLLDDAIERVRDIIAYAELLADPQTPPIATDGELKELIDEKHEDHLNLLMTFQSSRAFWESAKLIKGIDSLRVSEDFKKGVSRIHEAVKELALRMADCYPRLLSDATQAFPSGNERNRMMLFLAKSYEHLAGECHWLAESFPKRQAEMLSKLGDILSGTAEGLFKELDRNQSRNVAPEFECQAFIDDLLGAEREDAEERNFDDETESKEEKSIDVGEPGPSEAKQATTSTPSLVSAKEEKKIAALIQDVNRNREETTRWLKAINKDKRNLEKIEQKLDETKQEIDRIKRFLSQGAHIRYLAWDLENAPKEAAGLAQFAQRRASGILDKLKALEEISISAGAVSDERHRDEMTEYAGKAAEYEKLQKHYESEGKALRLAKTKAFLAIEGMRKSNAAKQLLTELVEMETGAESLSVTACKTLPKYPQAKNRFGILETQDGKPLYDHVVEFRVAMESAPEFLVHFHFRSPLPAGKTPDYYMEKMTIHDWNVQAVQKPEMEEKVRALQLEGGQSVLKALHDAWKKSLEMNRGKQQETAPRASAVAASTAPTRPSGKHRKGKARRS